MADAVYPLLRQRRRGFVAPKLGPRARPIAIGLLAFAGVMGGVFAATRPAPVEVAAQSGETAACFGEIRRGHRQIKRCCREFANSRESAQSANLRHRRFG